MMMFPLDEDFTNLIFNLTTLIYYDENDERLNTWSNPFY